MKFAYTPDGSQVWLGRSGVSPNLTGECKNSDRIWGMDSRMYTAPNGVLTPLSESEANDILSKSRKDFALSDKRTALAARYMAADASNFEYEGNHYIADKARIQGVQNDALARNGSERIRTFLGTSNEGKWSSVDGFIPFTNEEFILFAKAFFDRTSNNFTNYANHIKNIEIIENDPTKTEDDVNEYDIESGWFE